MSFIREAATESRASGVFGSLSIDVAPAGADGAPRWLSGAPVLPGTSIGYRTGPSGMTGPLGEPRELSLVAGLALGSVIGATTGGASGMVGAAIRGAIGAATGGAAARLIGCTSGLGCGASLAGGANRTTVGGSTSASRDSRQRAMGIIEANATMKAPAVMAIDTPRLDHIGPWPWSFHLGPFVASTEPRIYPPCLPPIAYTVRGVQLHSADTGGAAAVHRNSGAATGEPRSVSHAWRTFTTLRIAVTNSCQLARCASRAARPSVVIE